MNSLETLDVTKIEPKFKHPTIFQWFDNRNAGESFIIENDHDPKPLYYELLAERGDIFTWEYLEKGPDRFVVQISKNKLQEAGIESIERLDVTKIEPKFKHPTIFQWFDMRNAGESFIIENDHDPKPLYYELLAERGDIFTWEYLEKGPDRFVVQISKNKLQEAGIESIERLDVTKIEPKFKHPTIFQWFDMRNAGESFIIENDHDPKPLYYELLAERGDIFTWEYLEKGPDWYHVKISKNPTENTRTSAPGNIEKDLKKAQLLKDKGVNFGCNVSPVSTENEDYNSWDLERLMNHIVETHHQYIRENAENLNDLAMKVAEHHGDNNPELHRVATSTHHFLQDTLNHITNEEQVLFPVIRQGLAKKQNPSEPLTYEVGTLEHPIGILTKEHQIASEDLNFLRRLTNNFTPPANACNSYTFLYKYLKDFESDLQTHHELENKYLFPKALQLDKELMTA